jgi:2-polyprenyl-6-hydroxyphenyl methylase / 3-demethylubiquinone-9 3-methyltransferase
MEKGKSVINNAFYDDLKEKWYTEEAHPIALLRAENHTRNPWLLMQIEKHLGSGQRILDVGCGGGLLSNALAASGHIVTGVDLSATSLEIARQNDHSKSVTYLAGDATALPFDDEQFDVVCAMDFLEHVSNPKRVIREISRVLKKEGLFFFHTFNRNPLSWLVVIKGVDWLIPNAPKHMHRYTLFIKPKELKLWCQEMGLHIVEQHGLSLHLFSKAVWKSLLQRRVRSDVQFALTKSLAMGYLGFAKKSVKQCHLT